MVPSMTDGAANTLESLLSEAENKAVSASVDAARNVRRTALAALSGASPASRRRLAKLFLEAHESRAGRLCPGSPEFAHACGHLGAPRPRAALYGAMADLRSGVSAVDRTSALAMRARRLAGYHADEIRRVQHEDGGRLLDPYAAEHGGGRQAAADHRHHRGLCHLHDPAVGQ